MSSNEIKDERVLAKEVALRWLDHKFNPLVEMVDAPMADAPARKGYRWKWRCYSPEYRLPGYVILTCQPKPAWLFNILCWIECRIKRKVW